MTHPAIHIKIDNNIIPQLIQYCADRQLNKFMLVADDNTYPILGRAVEEALAVQGCEIKTVVLTGDEIIPNEHFIMQVLVQADTQDRVYLAVGSGVITDITRFASHRTKNPFISVPTAPSVDGYASLGAPLVIDGLKQTVYGQAPIAIFADVPTLCESPKEMIASGFGDLLGKYTSVADWRLGHLLWNEPFDAEIAQRSHQAAQNGAAHASEIGAASPEGIRLLMDGLIETGMCMVDFGESRPASGMEHHISHHLEMRIVWDNLPAVLHGAKVGVATLTAAGYYEQIRQLSQQEVQTRLDTVPMPDPNADINQIKAIYPSIADRLITAQSPFLQMSEQDYEQQKQKIIGKWPQVQEIAAQVPPPQKLESWLREVGAATTMPELGLSETETERAIKNSHFLRNRFTVAKLVRMLGML